MTERDTKIHFLEEPVPLELDNMTLSVAKLEGSCRDSDLDRS